MKTLSINQIHAVSGGRAMMSPEGFIVTNQSEMHILGMDFYPDRVCQNGVCSTEIFRNPVTYTIKGSYNGKHNITIDGHYLKTDLEEGALYKLS